MKDKPNRIYRKMTSSQQRDVRHWIKGNGEGLEDLANSEYQSIKYNLRKGDIEKAKEMFNEGMDILENSNEDLALFLQVYNYRRDGKRKFRELLFYDIFLSGIGKRSFKKEFGTNLK